MSKVMTRIKCSYKIESNNITAAFYINPAESYPRFYDFRKPEEMGSFISDVRMENLKKRNNNNENGDENSNIYGVKYLVLPKTFPTCNFDLNIGYSQYVSNIPNRCRIYEILKWILRNKSKFQSSLNNGINVNTDFISWRGSLTKLLATPYDYHGDWMFTVINHKNTWYLCELETEKQEKERLNESEKQKKFYYYGYKFESYVSSNENNGETEGDNVPDPEDNYSTVVRAKLFTHSLMYAGEIDCCFESEHKSLENYCEIKTSRGTNLNDLNFARNMKFIKWWLQSFLIGVKTILVGMRDDDGLVKNLVKCENSMICKEAKNWTPSVCFNFLKEFLDFIKVYCREQNCTYIIEKASGSTVIKCRKSFDTKDYFLQDWYVSQLA